MSDHVTLVVMAKSPVPGRVKTRLCPPCTPEEAATLAAAALTDTLHVVARVRARGRVLALDGPTGPWLPPGFSVVPQIGSGLAERLGNALAPVRGPAFLVGMDTPQITPRTIEDAVELLDTRGTDAVLGPAYDGGWWGIGLRRPAPGVFDDVEMSSDHTHADQIARLAALGLRTRALTMLRDVDTFGDALAVAEIAPTTRFARAVAALEPRLRARSEA